MPGPHGLTRHAGRSTGDNDPGDYLTRVIWSLAALSGLFLALRVYCKHLRRRQLWWDDYFLIASWIALVVSVALQTVAVSYGLGKHYAKIDAPSIIAVGMYSIPAGFCSILATCWSKTSFAISLLRISNGSHMRMFIWFIIISVNLVLGANGAIQWVQCWPIQKQWYRDIDGSCFSPKVVQDFNTFVAAYSGLMDIVLALLPWKIIWTVSINKREKMGAMVAMSAGVLSGVMAFLKIGTLYVIGNDNATNVDLFIFGTAEPASSIMAASIPILRTLIRREPHPKPAQFIELSQRVKSSSLQSPTLASPTHPNGEHSTDDLWIKASHMEQAHVRTSAGHTDGFPGRGPS